MTKNRELVDALSTGSDWNGLAVAEHAMLAYAHKLTLNIRSMAEEDVAAIRSVVFSDRAILEINLAAAYMNFVNRIAEGLGVEPEPSLDKFTR